MPIEIELQRFQIKLWHDDSERMTSDLEEEGLKHDVSSGSTTFTPAHQSSPEDS